MSETYTIRPMTGPEIDQAVDWAAREGWNPGLSDAPSFACVDPEGFWGGWLNDRMIASISVVNYDPTFAFLGFYIVDEPFRGQGYGYRLWAEGMAHAGDRNVGLDGVLAEQDNYRKSGFDLAHRNIRYGGVPDLEGLKAHGSETDSIEIKQIDTVSPELAAYDRQVFPAPRDAFLQSWLTTPGHTARAAYVAGRLAGYGVIRPCRSGRKIGPLFADDAPAAEALVTALLAASGDAGEIFLDTPEPNGDAVALAEALGLKPVFETARMYTKAAPPLDMDRMFGITTFELG